MWAWANQSLASFPALWKYAAEGRGYGRRHRLSKLVTPAWSSDLEEGWSMTALAVRLCGMKGAFCGIHGPLQMLLTFQEVSLIKLFLGEPGE
jgi:hypothetical protein